MKIMKTIICFIIVVSALMGCGPKEIAFTSENIIYGKAEEIDILQIDFAAGDILKSEDNKVISQLMTMLKGVELRELSVDEEKELFFSQDIYCAITMLSKDKAYGQDAKGVMALIFSSGEMVYADIKTMGTERTKSYVNVRDVKKKNENIVNFIKGLK